MTFFHGAKNPSPKLVQKNYWLTLIKIVVATNKIPAEPQVLS